MSAPAPTSFPHCNLYTMEWRTTYCCRIIWYTTYSRALIQMVEGVTPETDPPWVSNVLDCVVHEGIRSYFGTPCPACCGWRGRSGLDR